MTDTTRRFKNRVLCCVLTVTCLLSTGILTSSPYHPVRAEESVDSLSDEKSSLAEQAAALQAQRNESAETLAEQEQQKSVLEQQIQVKSQEIAVNQQLLTQLDTQISEKDARIAAQETQLVELNDNIASQFEALRLRLRAISKTGTASTELQLLMDSSGFVDYLINTKMAQRISQSNQALMDELETGIQTVQTTKQQLESDKASLTEERTQVASLQQETETGKSDLQSLYADADSLANKMSENVEYVDAQIAEIDEKQAALQGKIDDIMAQLAAEEEARRQEEEAAAAEGGDDDDDTDEDNDGGYSGPVNNFESGSMYWPAPTCTVITSSYKYREEFGRWHYGVDIACYGDAEGQPIVAAASGTVIYANRYDTWGDGYGLYLMIDHGYDDNGQRIITLYAHCSSVSAYEGMTVSAGDVIAAVGNTGNSYGAHLHFEVRVDGSAVNPVTNGYLSTSGIDVLG